MKNKLTQDLSAFKDKTIGTGRELVGRATGNAGMREEGLARRIAGNLQDDAMDRKAFVKALTRLLGEGPP